MSNCFVHLAERVSGKQLRRLAVKDNIAVQGMPLTCASPFLQDYVSPYTAESVQLLLDTGSYAVVGKTNMDEFGMGSSTSHSIFGPTRNAHNPRWSPGGSSGGSAVALSTGQCDVALGSDTGGSVRLPAACNYICGFKPTWGRVSRHGLVSYAPSMDTIGILARDVGTVRSVFDAVKDRGMLDMAVKGRGMLDMAVKGRGMLDMAVKDRDMLDIAAKGRGMRDKTIAVPREMLHHNGDAFVEYLRGKFRRYAVAAVSLPLLDEILEAYYVIASVEASSCMARYKPKEAAFHRTECLLGDLVRERVQRGTDILLHERHRLDAANRTRLALRKALESHSLWAWPTLPREPLIDAIEVDWAFDKATVAASLACTPAMAVPDPEFTSIHLMGGIPGTDEAVMDAAE